MKSNTVQFNLAPTQPNVNGIYYEKESYDKAVSEFFKKGKHPVYLGYNSNEVIGNVCTLENNKGVVELFDNELVNELLKDKENRLIGFSLTGELLNDKVYKIDSIDSAHMINKKDVEGSEYYHE